MSSHKGDDLTGRRFGRLLVLGENPVPYHSPSGKNARRWDCVCDCGKRITVTRASLTRSSHAQTSCGCARLEAQQKAGAARKFQKVCPICGETFFAPPSGNRFCSKSCYSIYSSQTLKGRAMPRSPRSIEVQRQRMIDNPAVKQHMEKCLEKALENPENQKGPQNRYCKVWTLEDPEGKIIQVIGLIPWARENFDLFFPGEAYSEIAVQRIATGLSGAFYGKRRSSSGRHHAVSSYKGWRVLDVRKKEDAEQSAAMADYNKRRTKKESCQGQ